MTVIEKLDFLGLYQLWRHRSLCPCKKILILRGKLWVRLFSATGQVEPFPTEQIGMGRVVASFLSIGLTEAMLRKPGVDSRAERVLLSFFKDEHILLAYRKLLAQWVEEQIATYQVALRIAREKGCTAITFIPTDTQSLRLLQCWREVQHEFRPEAIDIIGGKLRAYLSGLRAYFVSWVVAWGLLVKVLAVVIRQGIVINRLKPRSFLVALHNHWGVSGGGPWNLRSVDFLIDGQRIRQKDVLVLISGKGKDEERKCQYSNVGIAWAEPSRLPIPRDYAIQLIPRILKTAFQLLLPVGPIHPFLRKKEAADILYGVRLEIFLHHYTIRILLSIEEHSHQHIVETVVLNKFGSRTAWIPHTAFTNAGYPTAYIHYDLLPIQGWFPAPIYGKTWSRQMVVKPVGMPTNDGANLSDENLATEKVRGLIEGLKAHYKIVGVFTGSYTRDEFVMDRNRRFLKVLADLAEQGEELRLVIKPKASLEWPEHSYFLFEEPFRSILDRGIKNRSIFILDPRKGLTCAAQYLIRASDVVVSTGQYAAFGSVWVEALLLGRPSYVFAPSEFRLAPFADTFFDRWIFDDEEKLVRVIVENLHESDAYKVNGRVKYLFDPFNDGHAIDRLRDEIVSIIETQGYPGSSQV